LFLLSTSRVVEGQFPLGVNKTMNKENKRLAIFLPSFAGGGAEKSMITLAHGFAERGHEVDLVVCRAEGPHKSAVDPGVRVVNLNVPRVVLSVPNLVRYLRAERPAALLSTLDYSNVTALWAHRLAHVPTRIVVLEQNTISITCRESRQWRQRLMPTLVRYFYKWADHVVGNSQGVANDLINITGLDRARIHVIYNPVVTSAEREKAHARPAHPWFAQKNPPIVVAVGRLTPQKDFVTLIHAFADVRRQRPVRLVILGEGPDRRDLEALARRLEVESDVSFPGFVENPCAYMSHAAVFVLSSRWEGLPTVLIEALSCGTRVIATDCPSGPREILADGQYGSLVPVQNVAVLAQTLAAALDGRTPRPTLDSWRPYELNTVVDHYAEILFEAPERASSLSATA
jgi:glycosyltransferase involved in cell wall biosynthesis